MAHTLPRFSDLEVEAEGDASVPDSQVARHRALWAAVLGQVIVEWRGGRACGLLRRWFHSRDFEWICQAVGLDSTAVRERLLAETIKPWARRVLAKQSAPARVHLRRGRPPKIQPPARA